jgi:predicted transcriptional regulator
VSYGPIADPTLVSIIASSGVALFLAAAMLYSRLRERDVLGQDRRRAVFEFVKEHGASSATPLAEALGVHVTTAHYHLRVLQRHGLLVAIATRKGEVFAVANSATTPRTASGIACIEAGPKNVAFVRAVEQRPGMTQLELAKSLGLAKSTVSRRVNLLREAGWLDIREGRIELTPLGGQAARAALFSRG